jgi:hypothetical protein
MKAYRNFFAVLLVALLAACSTFGLEEPQSIGDRIAYANTNLTAVYSSVPGLVERGRITKEEGRKVIAQADVIRDALDSAQSALGAGDTETAVGKLQVAQALLSSVEVYLKGRK